MRVTALPKSRPIPPFRRSATWVMETMVSQALSVQHAHHRTRHNPATGHASPMNTSRKALPFIHTDHCTGCGWCVGVCPPHVLSLQVQGTAAWGPKKAQLHGAADCTGCALCAVRCPFDSIRMVRNPATDAAVLPDAGRPPAAFEPGATDAPVLPPRQDAP